MNPAGSAPEVELQLVNGTGTGGPVTCGVPWPRGVLPDPARLALRDAHDRPVPLQARILDRWPDGSARWILLDWFAPAGVEHFRLTLSPATPLQPQPAVTTSSSGGTVTIDTGVARFELGTGDTFPFRSVLLGGTAVLDPARSSWCCGPVS